MGAVTADPLPVAAAMAALALRLALALVFLAAAAHAWRDRDDFSATVQAYRILPDRALPWAARLLPALEVIFASCLLLPAVAHIGAIGGSALIASFTGAIVLNLRRGRAHISCGCGGGASQTLSWALVGRNLVLMACLGFCAIAPTRLQPDPAAWVGAAGMAASLALLYFGANQLLANAQGLETSPGRAR